MATTDTRNLQATVDQLRQLQAAGADIVRVAVPDEAAAANLGALQASITIPLVADIHFNHKLALLALEQGVQGIRLNPGNIGGPQKVREVARLAVERQVPIRVGVNAGSLEKALLQKYGHATPEAMVESARNEIRLLEDEGITDIKISLKASDVPTCGEGLSACGGDLLLPAPPRHHRIGHPHFRKHQELSGSGDSSRRRHRRYPAHLARRRPRRGGQGGHRSAQGAVGLRTGGLTFVACPTCGRCSVEMIPVANRVEKRLSVIQGDVHVAVMGCEVNGPGEAREADVGIAYGHAGYGLLFKKGKIVKRLKYEELESALLDEAQGIASGAPSVEVGGSIPLEMTAVAPATTGLHPQATEVLTYTRF